MTDAEKLVGTWRLVTIRVEGRIAPERGANPTGFITYHPSGSMHVVIQPDRPLIEVKGAKPTGEEALAAIWGYTAYFGTYTVDEAKKIVTHHRAGSVQPGWHTQKDFVRWYRFEGDDRVTLGGLESKSALLWERLK